MNIIKVASTWKRKSNVIQISGLHILVTKCQVNRIPSLFKHPANAYHIIDVCRIFQEIDLMEQGRWPFETRARSWDFVVKALGWGFLLLFEWFPAKFFMLSRLPVLFLTFPWKGYEIRKGDLRGVTHLEQYRTVRPAFLHVEQFMSCVPGASCEEPFWQCMQIFTYSFNFSWYSFEEFSASCFASWPYTCPILDSRDFRPGTLGGFKVRYDSSSPCYGDCS